MDFGPLVSIGMPVFNMATSIRRTVVSIQAQTYHNWELIVVGDGTTDHTFDIIRELDDERIRIIEHSENLGQSLRANETIDLARGAFYARMDGDDIAYPQRLERQMHYLEMHPEVDLLGALMVVFDEQGRVLGKRSAPEGHELICRKPLSGFRLPQPTFMGRLEWFRANRYNPSAWRAEDWELLYRTHRTSRFANIQEVLLGYFEPKVSMRKSRSYRSWHARLILEECRRAGIWLPGLRVCGAEVLKGGVDMVAVASGLHLRMLPHRAGPISDQERREWAEVWKSVT